MNFIGWDRLFCLMFRYANTRCAVARSFSFGKPTSGGASWLNADVHPEGYEMIALDYVNQYGHTMYMGPGFWEANGIVSSALDTVWIGEAQAVDALPAAVEEANQVIEDWRNRS